MSKLNGLHPVVKQKAEQLLINANKRLGNYKMIITQGLRTFAEQNALYAQGRTKPGNIVTNAKAGQSMHNYGLAIDFALVSPDGKRAVWDTKADFDRDGKADWTEVVEEAKKLGFEWGGDWRSFKDNPHFEMTFGLSLKDLQNGTRPPTNVQSNKPSMTLKPSDNKKYRLATGPFANAKELSEGKTAFLQKYNWVVYERINDNRLFTGTMTGKNVAEQYAKRIAAEFGWTVYVKEAE